MKNYFFPLRDKLRLLFFCLLLPGLAPASEPTAGLATPSGIPIVYERQAERRTSPAKFLQDVDRELTRLFRAPRRTSGARIVISPARRPGEVVQRSAGGQSELILSDAFLEKIDDLEFQRELLGKLLLLRFGVADGTEPLPDWLAAGFFDTLTVRLDTKGQVVRLTRNYPLLRALLSAGQPPDFRLAMLARATAFSGAPREAYGEICRFLLEMCAGASEVKDNALADYAVERMRGRQREDEIFAATLERKIRQNYAGRPAPVEELLLWTAEHTVFNTNFPRSGQWLLERLPDALNVECEVPDRDGKPSGELRNVNYLALPVLYRDDPSLGALARQQLLEKAVLFMASMPPELQLDGQALLQEIGRVDGKKTTETTEKLQAAYALLERKLRWRLEMEDFLEHAERAQISGLLLLRRPITESLVNGDFLSRAGTVFLDEAEKRYLD